MKSRFCAAIMTAILGCFPAAADLQAQGGRGAQGARGARTAAPVELTGSWVAVVSEDWRHRMLTPRKGDFESVPLNAEGTRVANTWDLAKDDAANVQCKAFGVGGIIRQPGRMRISWQDDNTMKMEFDAGTQTRILDFDRSKQPAGEKTWQGHASCGSGASRGMVTPRQGPSVVGPRAGAS